MDNNVSVVKKEQNTDPQQIPLWIKILHFKVTIIPLYIFIPMVILIFLLLLEDKYPNSLLGIIPFMALAGYALGELGKRTPIVNVIGGAAIMVTFLPPFLVHMNWIPAAVVDSLTTFMKSSNILYVNIAVLTVGSILAMNRTVLIKGFMSMFIPLVVGTLASVVVGVGVGTLLGLGTFESFFYIVIPIMAGGMGEGAIPLSIAYAHILGGSSTDILSEILPAVMLGSLSAVILAGMLKKLGEKRPDLTGNGVLIKSGDNTLLLKANKTEREISYELLASGLIIAIGMYLLGEYLSKYISIPAPITMIILAVLAKVSGVLPKDVEDGAAMISRFFVTLLALPILFGVGVAILKWESLISVLSVPYLITVFLTVLTMVVTGFYVGKKMNMNPIESALVTACHSGMGGAGDLAILTAANRMALMPFAQISTRIGGALTVIIATLLFRWLH
ncbi:2-hydroxycarboxylate transporter family protein [Ectobacillus funiculus]|uniref:2-hydroxycarboxylate transporter family protein n=1 Tax=Ectobacillus funiculus TaxID=137993 RepID=UPI0039798907